MTTLTPDAHAFAVRNEMSNLALQVHKLTVDAGGDQADALDALVAVEQLVAGTRRALFDLPAVSGEPR